MNATLGNLALDTGGVIVNILAMLGDANTLSSLDLASKLFHAPTVKLKMECTVDDSDGEKKTIEHWVSLVDFTLRRLSYYAGRGLRSVALPQTIAGPPPPNWTQVLLRELRRGFWKPKQKQKSSFVGASFTSSLFVTKDGKSYSCGHGSDGNLGHGNTENQDVPKLIEALSGVRVCAVSAGPRHSLFLTKDGPVYSCGNGTCGTLGHGNHENQYVPKLVEALGGQ